MDEITQYITKHHRPSRRGQTGETTEPVDEVTEPVSRDRGRRRGVLVAKKVNGVPIVAWSLCHTKKDKFTRATALKIAHDRINSVASQMDLEDEERRDDHVPIPHTVQKYLDEFMDRCKRYFKTNDDPKVFGRVMTEREAQDARDRDQKRREIRQNKEEK